MDVDYKTKTSLVLPFNGTWMVGNGGRTVDKNNHFDADGSGPKSQRFAYDFFSRYVKGEGKNLEDYDSFGSEVIAPGGGIVSQVVDGNPDIQIGETDDANITGNMVVIDHNNGEWSVLAHFKQNSINVKVGDRVKQGGLLGLCGNSGNTSEPHIHFHLQDDPFMFRANGLPAQFAKVKVDDEVKEKCEPERNQRVENI